MMLKKFFITFMNTEIKGLIIKDFFKVSLILYKMMFQNLPVEVAEEEKKVSKIQIFKTIVKSEEEKKDEF